MALLLLGVMAACSSSTSASSGGLTVGTASFEGTLMFMPAQVSASAAASQADPNHLSIVVTSLRGSDSCATTQMSAGPGVANVFRVVVAIDPADATTIIRPGTYSLGDGWHATYDLTDVNCVAAGPETATTGSLEIDRVDTSIHGIADMTFPTGHVVASFDAPVCETATAKVAEGTCAGFPACPSGHGTDLDPAPTETCIQF